MSKPKERETLGERLRHRREELEMSVEEAAHETQAPLRYITALEADEVEIFSAKVYALGVLKHLLETLKMGERELFLKEFAAEWEVRNFRKHKELAPLPENRGISPLITPARLGIAVGAAALLIFLAFLGFRLTKFLGTPTLDLQEPLEQAIYTQPLVLVKGKTEKESKLTVNGREIKIDESGNFSENIELPAGAHTLEFLAQNRFGKESKVIRNILIQ